MRGTLLYPLLVALITIGMIPAVPAEGTNKPVGRGASLLMTNCARCHAVGRTGASPHPSAPPFPTLSHRFKIEGLAEALAEGLSTGHPEMPEFVFSAEDVGAIIEYLKSIQQQ